MKKVKIEKIEKQQPEIDWNKKQWVQNVFVPSTIIQTTGEHGSDSFMGTALPCKSYPNGCFSRYWYKPDYQLLTDDIPFIISNKED